jgi:hypothetical protein
MRELREHERVQLGVKVLSFRPSERAFRATEESAVELIGEGHGFSRSERKPNLDGFSR